MIPSRRFAASAHRAFDTTQPADLPEPTAPLPPPAARIVRDANTAYATAKTLAADASLSDDHRDQCVRLALMLDGLPDDARAMASLIARYEEDMRELRDEGLRQAQEVNELRAAQHAQRAD